LKKVPKGVDLGRCRLYAISTMNYITNNRSFRQHPLWNLLGDAVAADTGGSTSQLLITAYAVNGWSHEGSLNRSGDLRSSEMLSWDNDEVYQKLVEIYR